MLTKLEIIINGQYSLYLPVEGVPITLINNEFNLLTNSTAENRPLSITETFEIPLDPNRRVFEDLRGIDKYCEIKYNDIVLIAGDIYEYSADEQRKVILITIISSFKKMVNYMGDNVFFLDTIDLSQWNFIIEDFTTSTDNTLLKFGQYNPMDTTTGMILHNDSNVNDYCKPSLSLLGYFQEVFKINGWGANWEKWTYLQQKVCLMPTTAYQVSSFGFRMPNTYTITANSEILLPMIQDNVWWNINNGCEIMPNNAIQPRYPNRNMAFKLKAQYTCSDVFDVQLMEGVNELAYIQAIGNDKLNYITDFINTKESIDPLTIKLINSNPYDITINFSILDFYNLFTVYETNEDSYLPPQGFMFPVADNFPKLTPLEIYREFLTLFQMAQTSNDDLQEVDYYFINDIPDKNFERIDVNPYLLWDGYTILSDKINGLGRLNAIMYNGDTKKQRYFKVDIAPLPASSTYFESLFTSSPVNKLWNAAVIPALKYKVKTIEENIAFEYLEWSEVKPQLAYYNVATRSMQFDEMKMPKIVANYWSNMLTYLSSFDGYVPTVYELKLRLFYYQYKTLFGQRNLFYYLSNAMLLDGKYDVINQEFTGTFISLR